MAATSSTMTHTSTRLPDANERRLNVLAPLRGYAEEPLVPLKEAVVKLRELLDDVDVRIWTATGRSENPADKLTQDESAAIVLYTMEWDPSHRSLYLVLNRTLRLEDRRRLIPWFPYLKLVLIARCSHCHQCVAPSGEVYAAIYARIPNRVAMLHGGDLAFVRLQ
ncbi:unnamed protein product [Rotaria sp. Silwood2]|nr:unnamed protein product [Rotaria sp. Silwood2]